MRPPLNQMSIRTPELDEIRYPKARYPHMGHLKYPFGGTMGTGVRSHGLRSHAGWDLYAPSGTAAFAILDGDVVQAGTMHGYGNVLLLEFEFKGRKLYALYAHLLRALVNPGPKSKVREGGIIAYTGTSGNAANEPPHLHFEIWTKRHVAHFPDGRISPGEVLGYHYDNMDNRMPYQYIG